MTLGALRPWDEIDPASGRLKCPASPGRGGLPGPETRLLLQAGRGVVGVATMEAAFLEARLLRRVAEEALKARRRLKPWETYLRGGVLPTWRKGAAPASEPADRSIGWRSPVKRAGGPYGLDLGHMTHAASVPIQLLPSRGP